jgi:hypothetical protein
MLPWLFGVLLLINLAVFYWGYSNKGLMDSELPALPDGRYEIRLASEMQEAAEQAASSPGGAEAPDAAGGATEDERTGTGITPQDRTAADIAPAAVYDTGEAPSTARYEGAARGEPLQPPTEPDTAEGTQ